MDLEAIIAGVGAIITAAGGTFFVVREFRRRDHIAANKEIEMLSKDLHDCRDQLVRSQRVAFAMRQQLAQHGIDVPEASEG